ncbi:hypothetical protein DCAR_0623405 [Daucus carota subsp. sativus]|uniref:Uncharacterized protein n=1 Tax=Daucus carota subsp. sativus TaxID=79200 RepID=A0AAF0XA32_DAUCS|nr:PREDICTED: uncharacterized protein LOC108227639 isoform X2 [Daucus carota subsp. sativus]WOH04000.1 hypothetical protein DCAR_0623405 [Daucus carota subsp. sativus]
MNEKPGSSETGHVPRSPGTALYRFLSNKAVMIQRQQTGHQKKDAQSNASISCETKRKGRGLTVETIYKRQNIGMFGESNRRSSLLETSASDIGSCNPTNVANAKYSGFLLFCTSSSSGSHLKPEQISATRSHQCCPEHQQFFHYTIRI